MHIKATNQLTYPLTELEQKHHFRSRKWEAHEGLGCI